MQTYNKSIKSDNLQLIYKIIHTTYKKSIKTYNPLQPLTTPYKKSITHPYKLSIHPLLTIIIIIIIIIIILISSS